MMSRHSLYRFRNRSCPSIGLHPSRPPPRLSAANRGAAVGAYSLFIELSLGITGPLVGAVAAGFGFASMFLFLFAAAAAAAAAAAGCGLVLSMYLYRQARRLREA